MKRLLKIGFDLSLLSFIPILSWFCLGIIVDKNLINIFTLTYPLQFIYYILKSIFSTGANISKEKDKNKDAVMSGLFTGIIVAIIIFGIILIKVDSFINFMNMDISIYKNFTIYSIILLFLSIIFTFVLNKLYYEEKNTLANIYSVIFNLINFLILIITSLITKNQIIIINVTLIPLALFTIYVLIKNCNEFSYKLSIINCIRYDSVELFNNIFFLFIFLFGLSNALEYGEKYAIALTFVALITDTQWDTADAIVTTAQIDISKNNFNYKQSLINAYKFILILFLSSLLMFVSLFYFYDLDMKLTLIYFLFEIVNFSIYPVYRLKTCYLQLEWSSIKTTTNKIVASILRFFLSLLKTPFCTGIGQVASSIYQFISLNIIFKYEYKIDKNVYLEKKEILE